MEVKRLKISFNPNINKGVEISSIGRIVNFQIGGSYVRHQNKSSVKRFKHELKEAVTEVNNLYTFSEISLRLKQKDLKHLGVFLHYLQDFEGEEATIFLEKGAFLEISQENIKVILRLTKNTLKVRFEELYPHDSYKYGLIPVWKNLIKEMKKEISTSKTVTFKFGKGRQELITLKRENKIINCQPSIDYNDTRWFVNNFGDLLENLLITGSIRNHQVIKVLDKWITSKNSDHVVLRFRNTPDLPLRFTKKLDWVYIRWQSEPFWISRPYSYGYGYRDVDANKYYSEYLLELKNHGIPELSEKWSNLVLTALLKDIKPFIYDCSYNISGINYEKLQSILGLFESKSRKYRKVVRFIDSTQRTFGSTSRRDLLKFYKKYC